MHNSEFSLLKTKQMLRCITDRRFHLSSEKERIQLNSVQADIKRFAPKVKLTPKIIYLHLEDQKNRDLGAEPELPVYFPWSCLWGFPQGLDCLNSKYRCLSFNKGVSLYGTGFFIIFPFDLNFFVNSLNSLVE